MPAQTHLNSCLVHLPPLMFCMNFTVSRSHSGPHGNPTRLLFCLLRGAGSNQVILTSDVGHCSHASGETVTSKSEQIFWSLSAKIRISLMNSFLVI